MRYKSPELVVLSDAHLGTVSCHTTELLQYLQSTQPDTLVLNGDFIDVWNFKKYYWPESHMMVLRQLFTMMTNGTDVNYSTGNHDEVLRKISALQPRNTLFSCLQPTNTDPSS